MRFHLVHIQIPRGHGLLGYREVIDTVGWGLTQLGHTVSYGVNQVNSDASNIVFGMQVVADANQASFPDDTIVYNFEQLRGGNPRRELVAAAQRFRIWDYSDANLDAWTGVGTRLTPVHVPVSYAPVLERIPKAAVQDIDVLVYGMPNELRLSAFHALAQLGLCVVFVCGLYGAARDELISRAKLVLNVTLYGNSRVFEVVRVSYLWANRKAVIANIDPGTAMEDGVLSAIIAVTRETLQRTADAFAQDERARDEVAQRGYDYFRQRDIRPVLEAALEQR